MTVIVIRVDCTRHGMYIFTADAFAEFLFVQKCKLISRQNNDCVQLSALANGQTRGGYTVSAEHEPITGV